MSGTDAPPPLKDCPKMAGSLQGEIAQEHHLKHAEVSVKNVLPTAEDVVAEKVHQGLLKDVQEFTPDKLKHAKTREPASGADVLKVELAHDQALKDVSEFDKSKLKHAETHEKNPLPDKDAIRLEEEHLKFKGGIETFDKDKLAKTPTIEKNTLPTQEIIEQEKKA